MVAYILIGKEVANVVVSAVGDAKSVSPDVFTKGVAHAGQVWHARGLNDTIPPQLLDDGGIRVEGVVF